MFEEKCPLCKEDTKSPYTFKDSENNWRSAHKDCCNQLSRKIEDEIRFKKFGGLIANQ